MRPGIVAIIADPKATSGMTIVTDPRCVEYRSLGHPERPARVARTADLLRGQKALEVQWAEPLEPTRSAILRAHDEDCLTRLEQQADFDPDTPWMPGIADHARRSVGAALKVAELADGGTLAFSLMRPPGHHATRSHSMGFCYLNSIAVAALEMVSRGRRVAVFDFDVHHGNGTEDILSGVAGAVFASVHQFPCYPGTGGEDVAANCFNFPVTPGAARAVWRDAYRRALERIAAFQPDIVGVSAGFDAFAQDPLAHGALELEDFQWLGAELHRAGWKVFSVLEGGYSLDLPELILSYLVGLSGF